MGWKPELEELAHRRELMQGMGGRDGIDRQHGRGKLTVRERLPLLADPGTFQEFGHLRGSGTYDEHGELASFTPQGKVDGMCRIDGRKVVVTAGDFTVRGGSGSGHGGGLGEELERVAAGARVAAAVRPAARCRRWQRAQLRGDRPHVPP